MQLERLAVPPTRLPFVNAPLVYLPRSRQLAANNYSGTGRDCCLHLIDTQTLAVQKHSLPQGEKGAYGFVRGSDNRLYLGTFSGSLYRFDPRHQTLTLLGRPFQEDGAVTGVVWHGGASRAGRVYMGAYPQGNFCEYDIAGSKLRVINPMPPRKGLAFYARAFFELPDGNMLVFVGGARPALFVYPPGSARAHRVRTAGKLPTALAFEGLWDNDHILTSFQRRLILFDWRRLRFSGPATDQELPESIKGLARRQGVWYGFGYPSGTLYRLRARQIEPIDAPVDLQGGRPVQLMRGPGDDLISITDTGVFFRFRPGAKQASATRQLMNSSRKGMEISMLSAEPRRRLIIGAHFINMQIFVTDRQTGKTMLARKKVSGHSGQVTCGHWLGRHFYFASYGNAVLYCFDPARRFVYGCNPRIVALTGHEQNRPNGLLAHDRRLYLSTKADYGCLGGAISVYTPSTGKLDVYRHFVPAQNPTGIFIDPQSGRLAGGTEIMGDQGSAAPAARQAVLFVWDTATRKTLATFKPWPAKNIVAAGLSPSGVLIGFSPPRVFCCNLRRLRCKTAAWPHGRVHGGLFLDRRRFLALVEDGARIYDIETETVVPLDVPANISHLRRTGRRSFLCVLDANAIWRWNPPREIMT